VSEQFLNGTSAQYRPCSAILLTLAYSASSITNRRWKWSPGHQLWLGQVTWVSVSYLINTTAIEAIEMMLGYCDILLDLLHLWLHSHQAEYSHTQGCGLSGISTKAEAEINADTLALQQPNIFTFAALFLLQQKWSVPLFTITALQQVQNAAVSLVLGLSGGAITCVLP